MAAKTGKPGGKVGVGVMGGSGYIGAECLRYLAIHPRLEIRWVTANTKVGEEIGAVLPNLRGIVPGSFIRLEDGEARLDEVGAVLVSLPHNDSQHVIPRLANKAPSVVFIDMAGDFQARRP
jgi:N-acetyl-gamma-glutamylphosphate reductase